MMEDLKNIIESLLFVAEGPLSVARLKQTLGEVETKEIRTALRSLQDKYEASQSAIFLHEVAGGFQFRTRSKYNPWVKRLLQPSPLRVSKAALETLAIVAYNQPVIRSDVERIRGVDSGGTLRTLLERKLVRILGRKDIPGRPLIYATTRQFLEVFDLKNLKDLPTPKEIEAYMEKTPVVEDPLADEPVTDDPAPIIEAENETGTEAIQQKDRSEVADPPTDSTAETTDQNE
jgi:segregation and condensation protein B